MTTMVSPNTADKKPSRHGFVFAERANPYPAANIESRTRPFETLAAQNRSPMIRNGRIAGTDANTINHTMASPL